MTDERFYNADEVCKELGISIWTLKNWYAWERKIIEQSKKKPYLPQPIREIHKKGRPRKWTYPMILKLKKYQSSIVIGRNGKYGDFTNSYAKKAKKFKE